MSLVDFKEAKDVGQGGSFLQESGIQVEAKYLGAEYADGPGWEAIDLSFETKEGKLFRERYFKKGLKEEDIDSTKTDDKWVKGVKSGKLTVKEQVKKNIDHVSSLIVQVGKATGHQFEDIIQKMGECDTFKEIAEKLSKNFDPKSGQDLLVNFGTYWYNNDSKQTSNLRLVSFNANKLAISKFEKDTRSNIEFSDREKANMDRKYQYTKEGEDTEAPKETISGESDGSPVKTKSIFGED